jgi:hypothetical protein
MATVTLIQTGPLSGAPTALAIPVPARIREKKKLHKHLSITDSLLEKFKITSERYKEMSTQKSEFDNGEISIVRDANFGNININDPETKPEQIISIIENNSLLNVLLPIKTREDKEINPYIYLSSLRSLAKLISSDEEVFNQFKVFNLPVFPTLLDSISKIEEIFKEIDIEIFVCLGTINGDIL